MSSRSTQIIGGPDREHAHVESSTNALRVHLVNGSSGGGSQQYNEDAVHASGDTGTMVLAVRNDGGGSLVSADGDYASLQVDSTGALRVTSTGGGGGGTQYDEDTAHASGDTGTLSLVVRNDTPGTLADTDGDYAPLQVDDTGRLRVSVDASTALSVSVSNFPASQTVDDGGGSLTVDGSVTAAVSNFPASQSVDDGGGSLTVDGTVSVGNFPTSQTVDDGGGSLTVDGTVAVSSLPTATVTGTVAVTQSTSPWVTETNLGQTEDAAHASGDTGVMALAVREDTNASLVSATGDYAPLQVNSIGRLKCEMTASGTIEVDIADVSFGDINVNLSAIEPSVLVPVSDGGGSLTVDGTVTLSGSPIVTLNSEHVEDAAHSSGDQGIMMLAVRNDSGAGLVGTNGDYSPLSVNSDGTLDVRPRSGDPSVWIGTMRIRDGVNSSKFQTIVRRGDGDFALGDPWGNIPMGVIGSSESFSPTDGAYHNLTLDTGACLRTVLLPEATGEGPVHVEDTPATNGDGGMAMLAVRRDSVTVGSSADGDWSTINVDANGRLWVRNDNFDTRALSGSTRGRPIQITATASTGTTLHTATTTSGELDRVFIDLTNTSDSAVEVTIEFGATGTGNQLKILVPPNDTIHAVDGAVLGGAATDTITAFAATTNVINAIGRVERIPA